MRHMLRGTIALAIACIAGSGFAQEDLPVVGNAVSLDDVPLTNAAPTINAAPTLNAPPANAAAAGVGTAGAAPAAPSAPLPAAQAARSANNPASPTGGPPYELRYRFDQHGTLPLHTFVLKWASPSGNLQTIDVMVSDSKQVLQTIAIPQNQVHLVWQEIISKPGSTRDKIVDLIDFNFDKFADLRMLKTWPYKVGEKTYMVWLFNDKINKYEFSDSLSALPTLSVDAKMQRVTSIKLTGWAGGEYEQRVYTLDGVGGKTKLILQIKIAQIALDPQHLNFQRDIRAREKGELQRICKLRIPAEGKPKKLWGTAVACAPFLIKGPPSQMRKKTPADDGDKEEAKEDLETSLAREKEEQSDDELDELPVDDAKANAPVKNLKKKPASKHVKQVKAAKDDD